MVTFAVVSGQDRRQTGRMSRADDLAAGVRVAFLAFPPDGRFPDVLDMAGRHRPVFRVEMPEVGAFCSINLPMQAAGLRSMDQARTLAHSWAGHFQSAVRAARLAAAAVR